MYYIILFIILNYFQLSYPVENIATLSLNPIYRERKITGIITVLYKPQITYPIELSLVTYLNSKPVYSQKNKIDTPQEFNISIRTHSITNNGKYEFKITLIQPYEIINTISYIYLIRWNKSQKQTEVIPLPSPTGKINLLEPFNLVDNLSSLGIEYQVVEIQDTGTIVLCLSNPTKHHRQIQIVTLEGSPVKIVSDWCTDKVISSPSTLNSGGALILKLPVWQYAVCFFDGQDTPLSVERKTVLPELNVTEETKLKYSINSMLAGPTDQEKTQGYKSAIISTTTPKLDFIKVTNLPTGEKSIYLEFSPEMVKGIDDIILSRMYDQVRWTLEYAGFKISQYDLRVKDKSGTPRSLGYFIGSEFE